MNDVLRLFFAAMLAFSALMLFKNWEEWEKKSQAPVESTVKQEQSLINSPSSDILEDKENKLKRENDLPVATQEFSEQEKIVKKETSGDTVFVDSGRQIIVETDWVIVKFSEDNASIIDLRLKKHLLDDEALPFLEKGGRLYTAQSGLIGMDNLPNHRSRYVSADGDNFTMEDGVDSLTVTFSSVDNDDVSLIKQYVFNRSDYRIGIIHRVKNNTNLPINLYSYFQLAHDGQVPRGYSSVLPTFFGAGLYTNSDKFIKIPFDELSTSQYPRKSDNGWIGIIQRYFAAIWIPPAGEREFFVRQTKDGGGRIGVILPLKTIPAFGEEEASIHLFAGAQEQEILNALNESGEAPGINLIVDYGWLTFIAVLLFAGLSMIHTFVANWGVAIILLTVTIKLIFFPLSSAAYRSMAKMKEEAPRIKLLQEKFKNDKQRMQQEMMKFYREKKINPLGGCLPILIQIPVFIALYWVLLGSVELRQAPFFGWIDDLSIPDPYFILPLIMGGSMYLQTSMSPAPPDPTQAMIMRIMPIGFSIFSIFFPAGLVLYWVVNTVLSIAQQWYITRRIKMLAKKAT